MSFLVPLVMFGWIPTVLYLFIRFPAHRAVVVSFILAWLFLPQAKYPIIGLPDYTKMSATCYGILLATVIYDAGRLSSFKMRWVDLPMLIWCLCPVASSITNGLGAYDGFSQALNQTVTWGIPYFLGRIYLNNLAALRLLAIGTFIGGLSYVPLCLFEIRMSPQLHRMVYGFTDIRAFTQGVRYGGYRPTVFMQHGLEVGIWMMAATLIGICFWKTGVIKQLNGIAIKWLVAALLITCILVKSTGAYFLLGLGIIILFITWQFRTSIVLLLVILCISLYLAQNTLTETYITDQITGYMRNIGVPEERVSSLEFRFNNEELLADRARESIIFGWGGWGRNRIYDYNWAGELVDTSITDSLWIISFGINGLVGLSSLFLSFFLPVIGFLRRYPARLWSNRQVAPAGAIAVVVILYILDCLTNAMVNPIFTLACGGVAGVAITEPQTNSPKGNRSSLGRRYPPPQNPPQRSLSPRR
ncbi:MAG: O-antigen ligase domain-containing protein [Nostocaceae cyanobacterium]|nr:O-antigen ligase domain-containing protein [Nostocaceae cyanobacterium]